MPVNVAEELARQAAEQPDRPAVWCPAGRGHARLTYAQLNAECDRLAHGLRHIGVGRGTRTVLMVPPSLELFALTFAMFKAGAVLIMIDPGMGIKNLGRCLDEAEPGAFVGVGKAHIARRLLGWGRRTLNVTLTTGRRWLRADHSVRDLPVSTDPFPTADTAAGEEAATLFTSGSTGVAKGAVYTHGIFAAQVDLLRQVYDIRPGETDFPTFPLFALFGPALGMSAVIPDMNPSRPATIDAAKAVRTMHEFRVTNMFGSPAVIDKLGRYGAGAGVKLPTLKRAISAGAPVSPVVLERFAAMLSPGVEVHTPYGATEALPVADIASGEILGETRAATEKGAGVCVGRPVPGLDVAVIATTDGAIGRWDESMRLPAGAVGEIVVAGPVVTRSYYGRDEATRLAKIADGDAVRHRMGDLGYLDESGRLWFCGRKSHRVEVDGRAMYTVPCEAVFNTHPAVFRSALVGVHKDGRTVPVICVELEPGLRLNVSELREAAVRFDHTKSIEHFLIHPKFPVDVRHNAKIFREKLAAWAAGRV